MLGALGHLTQEKIKYEYKLTFIEITDFEKTLQSKKIDGTTFSVNNHFL